MARKIIRRESYVKRVERGTYWENYFYDDVDFLDDMLTCQYRNSDGVEFWNTYDKKFRKIKFEDNTGYWWKKTYRNSPRNELVDSQVATFKDIRGLQSKYYYDHNNDIDYIESVGVFHYVTAFKRDDCTYDIRYNRVLHNKMVELTEWFIFQEKYYEYHKTTKGVSGEEWWRYDLDNNIIASGVK